MQDRYKIAASTTFYEFMKECRELVNQGYKPQGGICVVVQKLDKNGEPHPDGEDTTVYYQAFFI